MPTIVHSHTAPRSNQRPVYSVPTTLVMRYLWLTQSKGRPSGHTLTRVVKQSPLNPTVHTSTWYAPDVHRPCSDECCRLGPRVSRWCLFRLQLSQSIQLHLRCWWQKPVLDTLRITASVPVTCWFAYTAYSGSERFSKINPEDHYSYCDTHSLFYFLIACCHYSCSFWYVFSVSFASFLTLTLG